MRLILGDTETTGIKVTDKVCEVAWAEVDANLDIVASGMSLINPGIPIHYAASAINGISDAMVADAPSLDEYFESVGQPLMGEDVVFAAHNCNFDHRYLKPYMSEGSRTLCTLKCARILYPDADNHKQSTIAAMLGITVAREKAHSADGDLDVLVQLLRRMCSDFNVSIEDLMIIQNQPRPIKAMPFGKYRGTPLANLPNDYIHWLKTKADNVDADLRAALEAL